MNTPVVKTTVLRYYLDFVARYIPINKAILATLGGEGFELGLWHQLGVEKDHGWMVERDKKKKKDLIHRFKDLFSLCTDLSGLFEAIGATEQEPRLDAFHLDLCGTLEPSVEDFTKVLKLVGRGVGRCFAITVCEERRNLDLENEKLAVQLTGILGRAAFRKFHERVVLEQQWFGKEKGVAREMGVLLHLIELFERQKRFSVPDRIERVIYLSDMVPEKAFWMRTYLFHLGHGVVPKQERAQHLVKMWTAQPLREYRDGQFLQVELPRGETKVSKYQKLQAIAEAVGGEALSDFQQLIEQVERVLLLDEALPVLKKLVNGGVLHDEDLPVTSEAPVPRRVSRSQVREVPEFTDPSPEPNYGPMEAQFDILELLAQGGDFNDEKRQIIARKLGIPRDRNRFRVVGSLRARTQGEWRGNFFKRVLETQSELEIDLSKIAAWYSAIDGETVTIEQLHAEAAAAKRKEAAKKKK